MKKILLAIVAVALLASSQTFGQDNKKNIIKMNVFSLAVATFNFQFEHVMKEKQSAQLGFFYTGFKVSETKFSGFGVTPEYRFYASQKGAPKGFFIAPYLRYQSFSLSTGVSDYSSGVSADGKAKYSSFGGGAILGFQGLIGNTVSIEIFAGPAYNAGKVKIETDGYEEDDFSLGAFGGFGIRSGVTFGIAF